MGSMSNNKLLAIPLLLPPLLTLLLQSNLSKLISIVISTTKWSWRRESRIASFSRTSTQLPPRWTAKLLTLLNQSISRPLLLDACFSPPSCPQKMLLLIWSQKTRVFFKKLTMPLSINQIAWVKIKLISSTRSATSSSVPWNWPSRLEKPWNSCMKIWTSLTMISSLITFLLILANTHWFPVARTMTTPPNLSPQMMMESSTTSETLPTLSKLDSAPRRKLRNSSCKRSNPTSLLKSSLGSKVDKLISRTSKSNTMYSLSESVCFRSSSKLILTIPKAAISATSHLTSSNLTLISSGLTCRIRWVSMGEWLILTWWKISCPKCLREILLRDPILAKSYSTPGSPTSNTIFYN